MITARLFEIIARGGSSVEDQVQSMLEFGCESLGFELGIVSTVTNEMYRVYASHTTSDLAVPPGSEFPVTETYCEKTLSADGPLGFSHAAESEFVTHPAYRCFGLESYIGCPIRSGGRVIGTVNFSSRTKRDTEITQHELNEIAHIAAWLGISIERNELEHALARKSARLEAVMNSSLDGVMVYRSIRDERGTITDFEIDQINPAAGKMTGRNPAELLGGRLIEEFPGCKADGLFDAYKKVTETGVSFQDEFHYGHDGVDGWFRIHARRLGDGIVVSFTDVTEVRNAEQAASSARDELGLILDSVPAMIWYKDAYSRIQRVNESVLRTLGVARDEVEGRTTEEVHPEEAERSIADDRLVIRSGRPKRGIVEEITIGPGESRWVSTDKLPVLDDNGEVRGLLVVSTDITRMKRTEETLRRIVDRDQLTGVANRSSFNRALQEAVVCGDEERYAVMMLDFDRFKSVNDSLGHSAGDELLKSISARLLGVVKSSDLVARLGGDEFAILLRHLDDAHDAGEIAERIRAACELEHAVSGHSIVSTASIGIADSELGLDSADQILDAADAAMYRAKQNGRNCVCVADQEQIEAMRRCVKLAAELRANLKDGRVGTAFRPIFDVESGGVVGAEAIPRWPDGSVPSSEFISIADEHGLAFDLSKRVLRNAVNLLGSDPDSERFVTVSMGLRELIHPALPELISGMLAESGVNPARLVLETGVGVLEESRSNVGLALNELSGLGVRISIKDFGAEASSLDRVRTSPVNIVKLDRSLIASVHRDRQVSVVVESVVSFAKNLGMQVAFEGIETPEQLAMVQAFGGDWFQGYPAAEPVEAESFAQLAEMRRAA